MLHLVPEQVRPLQEAGAGQARASRLRGIREGWAWAPRRWTQVTDDTGIGNPAGATPEKGAAYVAAAVERIAGFIHIGTPTTAMEDRDRPDLSKVVTRWQG